MIVIGSVMLARFIREQHTADATFPCLKIKFDLKIQPNASGNYRIIY